jgi:hypothetical protein
VNDIRLLMKDLNSALIIHVKRALNEEVHLLAKSCISLNSSEVFLLCSRLHLANSFFLNGKTGLEGPESCFIENLGTLQTDPYREGVYNQVHKNS